MTQARTPERAAAQGCLSSPDRPLMEIRRGIAVSPGVAIGPALVLDTEGARIPRRAVEPDRRDAEVLRLRQALAAGARAAREQEQKVSAQLGRQYGGIFAAHALLIEDSSLCREVEDVIRTQGFSAEYAFSRVMRRLAQRLESLEGGHFTARVADLLDIEKSVLRAGVLNIPAVVGLGRMLYDVSGGDLVIVDGHQGVVILDPDDATLKQYEEERQRDLRFETSLERLRELPAVTADGVRVELHCNIEFPEESAQGVQKGAEGVGLYRTEFLYLDSESDPAEEDHFAALHGLRNCS